jgi:homocysteine S-methyltransferase
VPDYPKSGARVSAMALSVLLERGAHVETLLHYACRDRVLATMQSDLLGAHAMGVRNVLLVTGEPAHTAAYPDATSVFDVDSIGLTNMVARLNRGLDTGGQPLGAPTAFHIGAAVNPFAVDLVAEWRRLDYKVEAGAEFLVTPPIFDLDAFDQTLSRLRSTKLPIIAGVVALASVRQAEFLASEVVGVRMPDALLDRLRGAADPAAEGLAATIDILRALKSRVQGVLLSPLHGSPDVVEQAIKQL